MRLPKSLKLWLLLIYMSFSCIHKVFTNVLQKISLIIRYKYVAAIEGSDESDDGVLLPLLFSWLTRGACWLSGGRSTFAFAPCFSGGVSGFQWKLFLRSGAEDLSRLCWRATRIGKVIDTEEGGRQNCLWDGRIRVRIRRNGGESAGRWWWWGQCHACCLLPRDG